MSKDFRDNQASNYGHYTDTDVGNADARILGGVAGVISRMVVIRLPYSFISNVWFYS